MRGGTRDGKGKGSTAYGQAHRKGQGLTAQGRTHTLTQTHSKEGSKVLLTGPLQAVSEPTTALASESEPVSPLSAMEGPSNRRPGAFQEISSPTDRPAKRHRIDPESGSESAEDSTLPYFKPSSLIKSKEGTFQVPPEMLKYLNKYMKHCLSKIAIIRPLTAAWQHLLEAGLEVNPDMVVPATEVLTIIQQTICLVGNASEFTSQIRRAQILGMIDTSWSKFNSDSFASATDTLFGEKFQESLGKKVEKETALSKAVSITKKNRQSKDGLWRLD